MVVVIENNNVFTGGHLRYATAAFINMYDRDKLKDNIVFNSIVFLLNTSVMYYIPKSFCML